MNVLKWQKERQDAERARRGSAWVDHDLVFARDGFKLYRGGAGGPQDPEKVSARWRTLRTRLKLPEEFRVHDWRHSKVTNDLEAGENPVEVSANVRHHSLGHTMARYGHSRKETERADWPPPVRADLACHPWSDLGNLQAVGHVDGHVTV
ncbi:tyrosine-type recombinase/integrase [Streptomyces sp. NPDC004561]